MNLEESLSSSVPLKYLQNDHYRVFFEYHSVLIWIDNFPRAIYEEKPIYFLSQNQSCNQALNLWCRSLLYGPFMTFNCPFHLDDDRYLGYFRLYMFISFRFQRRVIWEKNVCHVLRKTEMFVFEGPKTREEKFLVRGWENDERNSESEDTGKKENPLNQKWEWE